MALKLTQLGLFNNLEFPLKKVAELPMETGLSKSAFATGCNGHPPRTKKSTREIGRNQVKAEQNGACAGEKL
jgi:hypothetical protein